MRIVIFSNPDSVVSYPFEGVSAFGQTIQIGTDIVGEYNGTATPAQLPDYVGSEFPPDPPPVEMITVYRADIFRNDVLTGPEWAAIVASVAVDMVTFLATIFGRNGLLDVTEQVFIDAIDAGVTATIFSAPRGDELKAGITQAFLDGLLP